MNLFEKIVRFLQFEMERPHSYGWFHLLWLGASLALILFLCLRREKDHERSLRTLLLIYGLGALLLEAVKQIIWSYSFDPATGTGVWDYQWYAFPFQLCTTPIFVSLIAAFLKKGPARDWLLSFLAFVSILGSLATALYPETCFVSTVMVDLHTMYLHLGSLVVSVYLLATGEIRPRFRNLLRGFAVFLIFAALAELLNLAVYRSGVLQGESFNMFYISPWFPSSLPVFDRIQASVPFPVFLLSYLLAVFLGALLVFLTARLLAGRKRKP